MHMLSGNELILIFTEIFSLSFVESEKKSDVCENREYTKILRSDLGVVVADLTERAFRKVVE
jgi:hypothetical protein